MITDPILIEQSFDQPIAAVWTAITEADQMRQWFFESMTEFRPVVGFETRFNVKVEGKDYLHIWKVSEAVAPRRISYSWRYGGYPGDSQVTWELSEERGKTKLKLTHTGQETIEGDPLFSRENCVAGWIYLVQESLKSFLDDC